MKLEKIKYNFPDNTERNVYVLLPEIMPESGKLRVLYMFDGQSVVIGSEYTNENWGIEEAIENSAIDDLAVVAIEHAGIKRMTEYLPFNFEHHGKEMKAGGPQFADFLTNDLIVFLENKYPFIQSKEARYLAGSSMGAIIIAAFSASLKDYFSKFGIFSLASWIFRDKSFYQYLEQHGINESSSYYVYVGDKEGYSESRDHETQKVTISYLKEYDNFLKYLKEKNIKDVKSTIGQGYNHSEKAWKMHLPEFIEMLK